MLFFLISLVYATDWTSLLGSPNSKIKHLVVLVLENRSFDSIFGTLKGANGLTGKEYNVLRNGTKVYVRPLNFTISYLNPGHSFGEIQEQIYGQGTEPTMSGFARNAEKLAVQQNISLDIALDVVMGHHDEHHLPVTYKLAKEFAVIDQWHASVPSSTHPNRHFVHCATSGGSIHSQLQFKAYPFKTVYEELDAKKISWKIYFDGKYAAVWMYKSIRKLQHLTKMRWMRSFFNDAKKGKLPAYTFIEPDFDKNDDHPPHDLQQGQKFLKRIYEALRSSPNWNSTLFLVTYDEHGGFYDHVVPPSCPSPDGNVAPNGFKFDRVGIRVPTILISPLIPKGKIFSSPTNDSVFEHSSISSTLNRLFGTSYLTKRDAWAVPFDYIANLDRPRTDCPLKL